jgi:hypothetical protein
MIRSLVLALVSLCATQGFSQNKTDVVWNYDTPQGFSLLEPSYRFPIQIKQALLEQVQPVPSRAKEYDNVFRDKLSFSIWFRGILEKQEEGLTRLVEAGKKVLESKAAKDYPSMPIIQDAAKRHTKAVSDLNLVQRYLIILKEWCPEAFLNHK